MANYTTDLTDILNEIITGMKFPIAINSVVRNSDGSQTLFACDVYHAQIGFPVIINNQEYKIAAFNYNDESVTVTSLFIGDDTIIPGITFELYSPYFFHGTPAATSNEINKESDQFKKIPMIWLWENFTEQEQGDLSAIDRKSDVELYFLTHGDWDGKLTEGLYSEAVKPMRRLYENFKKEIKQSKYFYSTEMIVKKENYSKFGVYIREKGANKNILVDKLSGVSAKTTFEIYKTNDCEECEDSIDMGGIGYMQIQTNFIIN